MPVEIERKYLLPLSAAAKAAALGAERLEIEQVYLASADDERLRRVVAADGTVSHWHTVKRRLSSLAREEDERAIDPDEYARLRARADPDFLPIEKTRLRLRHEGHLFELDVFARYPEQVLMEVELAAESERPELPPLGPAREVSGDDRYSSRELARRDGRFPA